MSQTGFKAGGVGKNTGEVGRRDPLGFGTAWLSLFRDPSVQCGKEGHSF